MAFMAFSLERFRARDDFNQFLGDLRLTRAIGSVKASITSPALRVAESMALILAPNSPATFSSSARKICTVTLRGKSSARISASSGS